MAGATFTIPLITVIPGQLITASLWNNEFNNIGTNLNPSGLDGYSDTDTQMQIQTNPFPGSVTSHATSTGGEFERIRYQISAILGATTPDFWYAAVPIDLTTVANAITPLGAIIDYPSATPPSANFLVANGQAIGRTIYANLFGLIGTTFGTGDGSTTFNIPNLTDRMAIAAGNLYALAAVGGAVSNTPNISITDPGHNHTQNSHTHTMANHTHSTPNHTHTLSNNGEGNIAISASKIVINGAGTQLLIPGGGGTLGSSVNTTTVSGGGSTSGTPSNNTSDATTATNNSATTGITASLGSGIATLPPYLGLYKMMRVL